MTNTTTNTTAQLAYRGTPVATLRDFERALYADDASRVAVSIIETLRDYRRLNEDLGRLAARLARIADDITNKVAGNYHVNSLGEVQGTALDIDRTCALREAKAEEVRRLVWACEDLTSLDDGVTAASAIFSLFAQ